MIDRSISMYVSLVFLLLFNNIVVCDADILGHYHEGVLYTNTFISRTLKYICSYT